MDTFTGKTVLISGASSGIGRALALALAHPGTQLALTARDAARLAATAQECAARGAAVLTVSADVARPEDCTSAVEQTLARYGSLDALVNNAGVTMWGRFDALRGFASFGQLLAVNYLGAVYLTAAALPHLKRSRGLIVAVASVAGLTGVPERTGYAASKHAMIGFFESLRIELRGSGVDVTVVAPDFVASGLHRRALGPDGRPYDAGPLAEAHVMSSEQCARLIVRAMGRRQRLLITSRRGSFVRWARLIAPALVDRLAARAIRERR
ncbi:MAG TPA: SDR family oxidoreductase [Steroidobacteraceae bacterium]|jgi:short-subunit dehydrogenase|nr:SDR family oxidoreductase [Steroidobacteraceae bacterium]